MRPHHDRLANAPQRPAQLWRINALGRGTWPCGVNPAHGPSGTLDSRSMLRRASERGEMGSRMCVGNAHSPGATQVGTSPEGGAAPRRWLHGKIRPSKTRAASPELVAQGGSSPKGRTRAPGNVLLPRRCYTLAAVGHPACRGPGLPRRRPRPRQRARTVNVRVLYDRPHQTTARGRFARNAAERHTRFGRRARRLDGVRRGRPRVRWGGSPSHPSKNASWRFAQPSMTESPYRTSWPSRTQRNPSSGATPLRKRLTAHGRPGGSPLVSLRPLEKRELSDHGREFL